MSLAGTGAVRSVAAGVLSGAMRGRRPVENLLEAARSDVSGRDRKLLQELVLGTLRWLRFVDHVLEAAAGRPLHAIDAEVVPHLRLAVYQLLFLDRIPARAAVHAAVEEVKRASHRGAAGFANAVLRRVASRADPSAWPVETGDEIEDLAVATSYPAFLVRRWVERFGREPAAAALDAGNRRPAFQLTSMVDRDELSAELAAEGVATRPSDIAPAGLEVTAGDPRRTEAFAAGRFYIQDSASQAAALVPAPAAGERVLDVAAAPGGKCFALLAAEPDLSLVAADASPARLVRLRSNQERLGLRFDVVAAAIERPCLRAGFDRVVVDLPCAGTGTFARHPELKWRISERELARLAEQGLDMLLASADLVRRGGRLCAITCSVEREENEDVVESFLGRRTDFAPETLELSPELARHVRGPGLWRTLPAARHDGFTVHVLGRA